MSTELLTIRDGSTLEEALKILINNRITGMPVVNERGEMVGIVSEFDIMNQLAEAKGAKKGEEKFNLQQPFVFTRGARGISTDTTLKEILSVFLKHKYRRLPVVDRKNRLVGIITRRDLMRLFYYRARLP